MTHSPAFAPFALIGHHRSGTNFLTDILQAHSRVSFVDEPLSMHTRGFPETDLHPWQAAEYDPGDLHPELAPYSRSRAFFKELARYLMSAPAGHVRGFKETLLFEKMPWLTAAVPRLLVVHIVRDPRAVVASLLKHDVDRLWGYQRRLAAYFARTPHTPVEARCATPLERCVTSWKVRHHEIRARPPLTPPLMVRLEDILRDDVGTLGRIMSFLGQAVENRQIRLRRLSEQYTRGGMYSTYRLRDDVLNGWRHRLSPEEQTYVTRACEEEMHGLGYLAERVP